MGTSSYTLKNAKPTPVSTVVQDSGIPNFTNKLLVGTACTGLLRVEWVAARYNQAIPLNWGMSNYVQAMGGFMPLRYQVADAQNMIVAKALALKAEWLLLLEHDVVIPPETFVMFNRHMKKPATPVISGLYFSRAYPSEPMVFRGLGNGTYEEWTKGDLVWVDGVPTGCLLVHMSLLKRMWDDSEEYGIAGFGLVRKVFDTPRDTWYDPDLDMTNTSHGTSDLNWCRRVLEGDYLRKTGWYEAADKQWPFLVDTAIFCGHINPDGTIYPDRVTRERFGG